MSGHWRRRVGDPTEHSCITLRHLTQPLKRDRCVAAFSGREVSGSTQGARRAPHYYLVDGACTLNKRKYGKSGITALLTAVGAAGIVVAPASQAADSEISSAGAPALRIKARSG